MGRASESRAASGRRVEFLERDDFEGQSRHIIGLSEWGAHVHPRATFCRRTHCACLTTSASPRPAPPHLASRARSTSPPPPSPRALPVGDAPVSYARWRVMNAADVDGPPAAGASAAAAATIVVIDRLLTLSAYRHRGYAKQTLADCMLDILELMVRADVKVQRIAIFIPRLPACTYAAETALKCSLASTSQRPYDPTRAALPEFHGEAGVVEFAIDAAALLAMYKAAQAAPAAAAGAPS